jgi:aspartyl-tRNA(Asn)/glutamyl-tRNA(Gln) amidotransferase subunit C
MNKIDEAVVRHIAHLSRLKLSDEEVATFAAQLGNILEHFELLSEVNTDGVEPTAHAVEIANVLGDDAAGHCLGVEQALSNAPAKSHPYFTSPKVLDQETA